jgi:hypothetical protein
LLREPRRVGLNLQHTSTPPLTPVGKSHLFFNKADKGTTHYRQNWLAKDAPEIEPMLEHFSGFIPGGSADVSVISWLSFGQKQRHRRTILSAAKSYDVAHASPSFWTDVYKSLSFNLKDGPLPSELKLTAHKKRIPPPSSLSQKNPAAIPSLRDMIRSILHF